MTINILTPPTITDTHIYFMELEVDWDGVKIDRLSVTMKIYREWAKKYKKTFKDNKKSLIRFTLNKIDNKK